MRDQAIAIGVDIGGTTIRVGSVDDAGRLLQLRAGTTPERGDPGPLASRVRELLDSVFFPQEPPEAVPVGIALPGRIHPISLRMLRAVNLPALEGVRLTELFSAALAGRPLCVLADVQAAAQAQFDALAADVSGGQWNRVVYLSIGTGVGGAVVLDGLAADLSRGPGQFGHLIVETGPEAPLCRCGVRGCLEACFSGEIALRQGLTDRAIRHLTTGLLQLSQLWVPDAIILGGGVVDHFPQLVERCREQFQMRRGDIPPRSLAIVRGLLPSDEAGVKGAAAFARQNAARHA